LKGGCNLNSDKVGEEPLAHRIVVGVADQTGRRLGAIATPSAHSSAWMRGPTQVPRDPAWIVRMRRIRSAAAVARQALLALRLDRFCLEFYQPLLLVVWAVITIVCATILIRTPEIGCCVSSALVTA
jgi:hypothetical protein